MNTNQVNQNGRVNILTNVPDHNAFLMCDKIPVKDPVGYSDALKGNIECSPLSMAFFSSKNINTLQHDIQKEVYQLSNQKYMIDKQNDDVLKIIMRSVYLQNAALLPTQIQEQVNQLNEIVVEYCAPNIYSEVQSYMRYRQDVSTLAVPLERPKHSDYKYNTLELNKWF